jgi:hypothetical protein
MTGWALAVVGVLGLEMTVSSPSDRRRPHLACHYEAAVAPATCNCSDAFSGVPFHHGTTVIGQGQGVLDASAVVLAATKGVRKLEER